MMQCLGMELFLVKTGSEIYEWRDDSTAKKKKFIDIMCSWWWEGKQKQVDETRTKLNCWLETWKESKHNTDINVGTYSNLW